MTGIPSSYFPKDLFQCSFDDKEQFTLIVSPCSEQGKDLISWAEKNKDTVAKVREKYKAIVFSGFNLTKDNFPKAFTALTGNAPEAYKGDVPRKEVSWQVYQSSATANVPIPLHTEVATGYRKNRPKYISFFCVTPPKEGTGQTVVGDMKEISEKIKKQMPHLWILLLTKKLTYIARYLPENSWLTKWIRWLNPSHATIKKRFGTENKEEVEKKCQQEGLTCEWDGGWAVISRKGVPGTINVQNKEMFGNGIALDKLNPKLCGGWLLYIIVRIILYITPRMMQFDVKFDDGTPISIKDASQLISILKEHEKVRSWKKYEMMLLDNEFVAHGKRRHLGTREIIVAMGGSVTE